ncbi:MAG: hypothetical protein ACLUBM_02190 [Collinsella sp.]
MVEGYELVEYRDPKGRPFWELTTSPANSQFQKMLTDPKKKLAARKMIDQISKIYDYGLKVASGTSKLRCIDSKIGLYELKGFDGANREMIYAICQGVDKIVLLFWFKGHQGSGNISKEIERAKRLAVIARQLLETEL